MSKVILFVFLGIVAALLIFYIVSTLSYKSFENYINSIEWQKYYIAGDQYYYKKDYENAVLQYEQSISELKKEIAQDSKNRTFIFQVLLSKAGCLEKMGKNEEAMQVYQEVITENEKVDLVEFKSSCNSYAADALVRQGLIYLNNNEKDMADEKFTDSIEYFENGRVIDYNTKMRIERIIEFYKTNNDDKKAEIFDNLIKKRNSY